MIKRTSKKKRDTSRWAYHEDKAVVYEFQFGRTTVTPGMKFRIKNDRTEYTFQCLVTNTSTGAVWIEAISPEGFKSVRPEKISRVLGTKKRSYRKKVDS